MKLDMVETCTTTSTSTPVLIVIQAKLLLGEVLGEVIEL